MNARDCALFAPRLGVMVTHMVLFRFKNSGDAQEALERLASMKGRIAALADLEAGVDFTRSERSYDVGLITRHN